MTKKISSELKQELLNLIDKGSLNGFLNTEVPNSEKGEAGEDRPTYIKAKAEKIVKKSNSYIILGRDRMGSVAHGFGGRGFPNSNTIDLVVGLGSSRDEGRFLNAKDTLDKDMIHDAARVYISQRTNLDDYFEEYLGHPYYMQDKEQGVSGIGIKADSILIQGRRNIKIKAGPSRNDEKDSHLSDLPIDRRIELIAGSSLQPVIKGEALVDLLKKMFKQITLNRSAITTIMTDLIRLRASLSLHMHPTNTGVALPSPDQIAACVTNVPKDIEKILNELNTQLQMTVDILNSLESPTNNNILSKSVFTS